MLSPRANWREEFDERNGNDAILIKPGWLLFSNGAQRGVSEMSEQIEAPQDPYEQAKFNVLYHEAILHHAIDEFDQKKSVLKSLAKAAEHYGHPAPSDKELDELKELRKEVLKCNRKVIKARRLKAEKKPEYLKVRERSIARNRCDNNKFLSKLASIEV